LKQQAAAKALLTPFELQCEKEGRIARQFLDFF
jgi:hypothetical protein